MVGRLAQANETTFGWSLGRSQLHPFFPGSGHVLLLSDCGVRWKAWYDKSR